MTLRLSGEFEWVPCPRCEGRGRVPAEVNLSSLPANDKGGFWTPEVGHPIPCPECNGKKVVPGGDAD